MVWYGVWPSVCPVVCLNRYRLLQQHATGLLLWARWQGVVVRERGGTLFQQIFWSRNGAPANIVGHRWNANTEAFRQIMLYSLR